MYSEKHKDYEEKQNRRKMKQFDKKICKKCGEKKSINEFYRNKKICIECMEE